MTTLYKNLTDEQLKAEIERLKALISATRKGNPIAQGLNEVLEKYQGELELREKLSQ